MYQYWIFFLWFKLFVCRWLEILINWMTEELFLKIIGHWWKPCTTLIKQIVYKACLRGLFHINQCFHWTGCSMDAKVFKLWLVPPLQGTRQWVWGLEEVLSGVCSDPRLQTCSWLPGKNPWSDLQSVVNSFDFLHTYSNTEKCRFFLARI